MMKLKSLLSSEVKMPGGGTAPGLHRIIRLFGSSILHCCELPTNGQDKDHSGYKCQPRSGKRDRSCQLWTSLLEACSSTCRSSSLASA